MAYKYKRIRLSRQTTRDEHRLLIESVLGRKLKMDEHVHHINGNPKDNRLENLQVLPRHEHIRFHYFNGDYGIKPKYQKKELLEYLKIASLINENKPLAEKTLKKLIGIGGSTVSMRFNGWNNAKSLAGIL